MQELVGEGIVVLSDKKGSKVPVISETKKVVVKQVLDLSRSGDWLEPDLAHRRGLLDYPLLFICLTRDKTTGTRRERTGRLFFPLVYSSVELLVPLKNGVRFLYFERGKACSLNPRSGDWLEHVPFRRGHAWTI